MTFAATTILIGIRLYRLRITSILSCKSNSISLFLPNSFHAHSKKLNVQSLTFHHEKTETNSCTYYTEKAV